MKESLPTIEVQQIAERQLEQAKIKIAAAEERYRLLVESVKDYAIFMLDREGNVATWNTGAELILGYRSEEIIGEHLSHFFPQEVAPHDPLQRELEIAVREGRVEGEGQILRKNGSIFIGDYVITAITDENNLILGFSEVIQDITERRRAEEALRQSEERYKTIADTLKEKTIKLKLANDEHEAFTYSVSHDLRAPLRSLQGFSEALLEDYATQLDETGKEYLQYIKENSQLLGQLVDGLLALSRITRVSLNMETVNLSELARSIAQNIEQSQPNRHVEFIIPDGMVTETEPVLIRVVIQNLLDNAWKFTKLQEAARIEFGVVRNDDKVTYFVRDNGVGFNMAYVDKLFGTFQRLHSTMEFPGSGIGLASVKRIITRLGGEVWAEGEINKGATFYFTLGKPILEMQEDSIE